MAKLSQTAKRSYLYFALVLIIILILVLWPAPKQPVITSQDADTIAVVDTSFAYRNNGWYGNPDRQNNGRYNNSKNSQSLHTYTPDVDSSYRQDYTPVPARSRVVVDINTADTLTLQLVKGIGPVFARRIVNYRNRLGGFVSIAQLLEVYGLTAERVDAMAPYLTLSSDSISFIDINSVTIKELVKHPYIDYYQARDIVAYRNKGHHFSSVDDLRLVATLDDTTLSRLSPYLSFQ